MSTLPRNGEFCYKCMSVVAMAIVMIFIKEMKSTSMSHDIRVEDSIGGSSLSGRSKEQRRPMTSACTCTLWDSSVVSLSTLIETSSSPSVYEGQGCCLSPPSPASTCSSSPPFPLSWPFIVAHRGASGSIPEHTSASYSAAAAAFADYLEADIVSTKDHHLIIRHDNVLDYTTNVSTLTKFHHRYTTKVIDGNSISGYFTEDFNLSEIKELRTVERIPTIRPSNTKYNHKYQILTLEELIKLLKSLQHQHAIDNDAPPDTTTSEESAAPTSGVSLGVYIEIKHPSYFSSIGLPLEETLMRTLYNEGMMSSTAPHIVLQSFEPSCLKNIKHLELQYHQQQKQDTDTPTSSIPAAQQHSSSSDTMFSFRKIQLLKETGEPFDSFMSFADMTTSKGMTVIAQFAEYIGPDKHSFLTTPLSEEEQAVVERANGPEKNKRVETAPLVMIPRSTSTRTTTSSSSSSSSGGYDVVRLHSFVSRAHAAGLKVVPHTFRYENVFLPPSLRRGSDLFERGDFERDIQIFAEARVDGIFTDHSFDAKSILQQQHHQQQHHNR